eukprot:47141_1
MINIVCHGTMSTIITFGLVIIANSKFNWMINIFIFILMIIYVVTAFLFRVFPVGLFLLLLLFGVSATYTLKVSEMEKRNGSMQSGKKKQREDASKENKQTEDHENCTDIVYICDVISISILYLYYLIQLCF